MESESTRAAAARVPFCAGGGSPPRSAWGGPGCRSVVRTRTERPADTLFPVPDLPHVVPAAAASAAPGRLAAAILPGLPIGPLDPGQHRVGLIGLPDDTGVALNNGRPGARGGPAAFRAALGRYGVAAPLHLPAGTVMPEVFDMGDVVPASTLTATHDRVTTAVRGMLVHGLLPVAVGGGHDLTFPFVRAVIEHRRERDLTPLAAGLYADPHLDVRGEEGSGMAFRALIERAGVTTLVNVGAEPLVNTREHGAWFHDHGGRVLPDLAAAETWIASAAAPCFVSLDLDALDAAHAPGVSALNPCGLAPRDLARLARAAGRSPHVACFDLMELNPAHDADGRTARVAAYLFLSFLAALADRPA